LRTSSYELALRLPVAPGRAIVLRTEPPGGVSAERLPSLTPSHLSALRALLASWGLAKANPQPRELCAPWKSAEQAAPDRPARCDCLWSILQDSCA
jgi:hypothetical protein